MGWAGPAGDRQVETSTALSVVFPLTILRHTWLVQAASDLYGFGL
jgi:hypothetical protein